MVSAETFYSYPDCKTPFTVHTHASDKQLGDVISKNNKPIELLSRILRKLQIDYTKTEKELLTIVERPKKLRRILFVY